MKSSLRAAGWVAALALTLGAARMGSAADCQELKHLTWLLGSWRAETQARQIYEHWAAVSTESWEGFGETRARDGEGAAGAVLESESLRLVQMAGEVFYLAKVAHNPLPIAFRLSDCGEGLAVFENPTHDFPRRIEYRREGEALTVRVSDGQVGEGAKGFTLHFTRQ